MKRTKEEAFQTRLTILKTALVLFDEIGYSQTSLNQIATKMNVTRGAIYGHFDNKGDILNALSDQLFTTLLNQFDLSLRSQNIWREIESTFINFFIQLQQDNDLQRFFRILLTQKQTDPVFMELKQHYDKSWEEKFEQAFLLSHEQNLIVSEIEEDYFIFHFHATIIGLINLFLEEKYGETFLPLCQKTIARTISFLLHPN